MIVVAVLVGLGILFAVAAVVAGRTRVMSDPVPDEIDTRVPPGDVRMAPADVDAIRFRMAFRGYRMDQVDDALDRLREEIAIRDDMLAAADTTAASRPARPGLLPPAATTVLAPTPPARAAGPVVVGPAALGDGTRSDADDIDIDDADAEDADAADVEDADVEDADVEDADDADVEDGDVEDGDVEDGDVEDGDVEDAGDADIGDGDIEDAEVEDDLTPAPPTGPPTAPPAAPPTAPPTGPPPEPRQADDDSALSRLRRKTPPAPPA